jgi:hypothetical protein
MKPYIKPKVIKLPKETRTKRNIRLITERFNYKKFDSYEVAELLNISSNGAYKFLVKMVKKGIFNFVKGENNKLMFMIKK